jgi:two-component system sensor histidine kinase DesK
MSTAARQIRRAAARPFLWLHHRLLPDDEWVGWSPYVWLCFLGLFFVNDSPRPYSPLWWVPTAAGLALFLVLYFRLYRLPYHPVSRELIGIIWGVALLGYVFLLIPPHSGSLFVLYAAAFCGVRTRWRTALSMMLAVVGVFALEGLAAHRLLGLADSSWTYGALTALLVGVGNMGFAEAARRNRALKQSQEEIRRLAASAERERIARDLHDLLGHTLTLITVKSELAARLTERDMAGAAREIRQVERISRDALRHVREAVGGYRGGGLAAETVNARIALSAARIRLKECETGARLPEAHDRLLALTLREAITNVVRHSGAHECRISLDCAGGEAHLSVRDDGRGGPIAEGNGLRGMRERLQSLGGRLAIESGPAGTCVRAFVPLEPPLPLAAASA